MSTHTFPAGFLWGAATAAHQTEGGNTASDHWEQETRPDPPSRVEVISGDTCDSYHRYHQDMQLLADAGLGAYRFSIEWARIEPAEGYFSRAELAHYRGMVEHCLALGVAPVVTLNHATLPAWLGRLGGWDHDRSPALFERYVSQVLAILDGVEWVCTINEPNMSAIYDGGLQPDYPGGLPPAKEPWASHMVEAHRRARRLLKEHDPQLKVGWTVGCQNFRVHPGAGQEAQEYCHSREGRFLEVARDDDFIGVQNYSWTDIGLDGRPVPAAGKTRTNMLGWQIDPSTLAEAVRHAHAVAGVPVLVTEHGLATTDDAERISYTRDSLVELARTIDDGLPVLGYLHWSLLDNYEWGSYLPRFGLVAVDLESFERTPHPSLSWLGGVARANAVESGSAQDGVQP